MVLDLGKNRVEGGFFVHNGKHPEPYRWPQIDGRSYEIVGTYKGSGAPIRDQLAGMIRKAKEQVFIASFMLGDEAIIQELQSAADRLKGGVYVITALDEKSLRRGLQEYDEDETSAPEERRKDFERLTASGVYVRGHEECHAKFAVVDRVVALVGSANFVTNGFEWTGELNVVIRDPKQVQRTRRFFTQLWYEGCKWEVPPGQFYTIAERVPTAAPIRPDPCDESTNQFVWTNGGSETSLLEAVRATIDNADRELLLSSYSIMGMQECPDLILNHVRRARERGVKVKLLVRQRNAFPDQMSDVLAMHDMGVDVFGDLRNHAKAVVVDRIAGVVFSANLDSKHGLDSGVEAGVRIQEAEAVEQVAMYLDHAMANADTKFVRNPTLAELDGRLAARWCSAWPAGSSLTIQGPEDAFQMLAREAAAGPVLFEQVEDGAINLFAGSGGIQIEGVATDSFKFATDVSLQSPTAYKRLIEWLTSPRRRSRIQSSVLRGFCPAVIRWNKVTRMS